MIDQQVELERHHAILNEEGEALNKGTIPWLISEIIANLRRIDDHLGPNTDRVSKKALKLIMMDIQDQLHELLGRFR